MLKLKLKPGQIITIGDDVKIDVILGADRKLTLQISAPGLPIRRTERGSESTSGPQSLNI